MCYQIAEYFKDSDNYVDLLAKNVVIADAESVMKYKECCVFEVLQAEITHRSNGDTYVRVGGRHDRIKIRESKQEIHESWQAIHEMVCKDICDKINGKIQNYSTPTSVNITVIDPTVIHSTAGHIPEYSNPIVQIDRLHIRFSVYIRPLTTTT